jgi:hypothetical protein
LLHAESGAWRLQHKAAFKPCGSPKVYRNLKRGRHVFRLKSIDAAGNESPLQVTHFFAAGRRSKH